jgi:hypothetical protein
MSYITPPRKRFATKNDLGKEIIKTAYAAPIYFSVFRTSASELGVSVGSHMLYSDDADQENIAVKTVILHEDYDSWTITNDICLLELASEATFGAHVGAIALPAAGAEYDSGTMCTVTGWGATSEGGDLADVLQKVSYRGLDRVCGGGGGGRGLYSKISTGGG